MRHFQKIGFSTVEFTIFISEAGEKGWALMKVLMAVITSGVNRVFLPFPGFLFTPASNPSVFILDTILATVAGEKLTF